MTDDSSNSRARAESLASDPAQKLGLSGLPDENAAAFEAPWQARAFAIAVTLSSHHEDIYSWTDFQAHLVSEIQSTEAATEDEGAGSESQYYGQWLRALERIVLEHELVDAETVRQRTRAFADGDRDASEFIEGEHGHTHPHSEDRHRGHR